MKIFPHSIQIRAVVLDIDGTLCGPDCRISAANRAAVARVTREGLPVILATGRIPTETVGYYRDLGLTAPLVCYQGAIVLSAEGCAQTLATLDTRLRSPETGIAPPMLLNVPLPNGLASELVDFILAEQPDAQLLVGLAEHYVINRLGELAQHWDMQGPSRPEVGHLGQALEQRVYKICYYSPEVPRVPEIIARVQRRFAGRVEVQQAHAHLAEFLAAGVSKDAGATVALQTLGLTWSEVLAVGNYYNDAGMLRRAAIGVAVANAVDELKAEADFVTAACEADGVAQALERFVFVQDQ